MSLCQHHVENATVPIKDFSLSPFSEGANPEINEKKKECYYTVCILRLYQISLQCNLLGSGASHGRSQAAIELQHGELVEQLLCRLDVVYQIQDRVGEEEEPSGGDSRVSYGTTTSSVGVRIFAHSMCSSSPLFQSHIMTHESKRDQIIVEMKAAEQNCNFSRSKSR